MTKTSQSFTKQVFGSGSKKLGVKNFLMDLSLKLKIGPKLEDWFPKLGVVFACVRTSEIWWESGTTLGLLYTLGLNLWTVLGSQILLLSNRIAWLSRIMNPQIVFDGVSLVIVLDLIEYGCSRVLSSTLSSIVFISFFYIFCLNHLCSNSQL